MKTRDFTCYTIQSSYHKLPIKVFVKEGSRQTKTAFVLHPGAFESAWGDEERYKCILLWLYDNLSYKPHIITYQTARLEKPVPKIPKDKNYWAAMEKYWKRIFPNKTFNQELNDIKNVYNFIEASYAVEEIHALGFSLGGTFSLLLSSEFTSLRKICVLGSAISTKRNYLPVLTGYPAKDYILGRIKTYRHYLKIFQGFRETVVPFQDAEQVFAAIKKAKMVTLSRIHGADHMFSGKNKYGLASYKMLLPEIKHFFELSL